MEDFLLVLLIIGFVWVLIRQSQFNERLRRLNHLYELLLRAQRQAPLPPAAQPQSPPSLRPAAVVPAAATAPRPATTFVPPPPAPPKPHISLEARLGQNWLNKLGIAAMVVGIALYLGYQLHNLGPVGKSLVGLAIALGILGLGVFLERKPNYRLFARTCIGGGWALLFFLSFAIYHLPLLQVLHSGLADLVLMLLVASGMVAHSLRYKSQTVTTIAFFLAYLTVGISDVTLFSLVTGSLLAAALAVIVYRERWFLLGLAGVCGVYLNHFLWLHRVLPDSSIVYLRQNGQAFPEFVPSAALLIAYWFTFRIVYVFRAPLEGPNYREQQGIASFAAVLNSVGLLSLLKYQSTHPEWTFWSLLAGGAVELTFAFIARESESTNDKVPRNRAAFVVLSTIASVVLLAAIPFRFHGASWSLLWLLEAEALFIAGIRLPEVVFRRLGIVANLVTAALLTLGGFAIIATDSGSTVVTVQAAPHHPALVVFTVALVLWLNSELATRLKLFIAEAEFDRLAIAASSYLAALLATLGIAIVVGAHSLWLALVWAALGLALFESGIALRSERLRHQAYALLALSFLRIFFSNLRISDVDLPHPHSTLSPALYTVIPLVAIFAWVYERTQAKAATDGSLSDVDKLAGTLTVWAGLIATTSLLYTELRTDWIILGWTLLAVALLALAATLKRTLFTAQSFVALAAILLRGLYALFFFTPAESFYNSRPFTVGLTSALLLFALPVAFYLRTYYLTPSSRPEAGGRSGENPVFGTTSEMSILLHRPEQPFFFTPLTLLTLLLFVQLHGGMVTIGWVALGVAAFLFALTVKERSFRLSGLGLLLLSVAKILLWDVWQAPPAERYLTLIVMGAALLLVSFLYSRYRETLLKFL